MSDYKAKLATLPARAVFYDCLDSDTLTHENPFDAVLAVVEFDGEVGVPVGETIRARGDVEVQAYERVKPAETWLAKLTDAVVDQVTEAFDLEYGDPEGDHDSSDEVNAKRGEIEATLRNVVGGIKVWTCAVIGTVTLTPDEVIALVRDRSPGWFDDAEAQS